jgi:hypothetical protein
MAIIAINPTDGHESLTRACASCGAHVVVPLDGLRVGVKTFSGPNTNLLRLPRCACGAWELLHAAQDGPVHPPPQLVAVRALVAWLWAAGKGAEGVTPPEPLPTKPDLGVLALARS